MGRLAAGILGASWRHRLSEAALNLTPALPTPLHSLPHSGRSNSELEEWFAPVVGVGGMDAARTDVVVAILHTCCTSQPQILMLPPLPPLRDFPQPNLGLVAENGFYLRAPGGGGGADHPQRWQSLVPMADFSWKKMALPILQTYAVGVE